MVVQLQPNDIVTDKKFQDQFMSPNTTFELNKVVYARAESQTQVNIQKLLQNIEAVIL